MAGLLDGIFGEKGSEDRLRMKMGLMGLTHRPNQQMMAQWSNDLGTMRDERKATEKSNRTMEWMRSQAAQYPQLVPLLGAMETGGIDTGAAVNAAFQIIQDANKPKDYWDGTKVVGDDVLRAGPDGIKTVFSGTGGGDTAKEQSIARIKAAYGVDDKVAVGIVDGVLNVSRDPTTQDIIITNLATGEVFKPQTAPQTPAAPMPVQAAPPVSDALSFGNQYPSGGNVFGMEGFAKNLANTVTDVLPLVGTAFPDEMQTSNDFKVLREQLVNDVASAYERQPPSWLLQNIQDLAPTPNSVMEGADAAASKLKSLGRAFQQEMLAVDQQLAGAISPTTRQTLEARRINLEAALGRVKSAMQAVQPPKAEGNKTKTGVTYRIVE